MTEAADRLRLTQLLSPAFPIGSFAHAQGLECAITDGAVTGGDSLRDWIAAVLRHGSGWTDAVFLSLARRRGADDLAALYDAYLPCAGRALESAELGRGFRTLTAPDAPPLPYVLALARETRALRVPESEVLALFLQSLAAQLVSAAVRFLPLGQAAGQRVLAALAPVILAVAADAATATEDDLATFTWGADLAAMAQETLDTRIFRS
jgi:urease accessory protein